MAIKNKGRESGRVQGGVDGKDRIEERKWRIRRGKGRSNV